MVLVKKIDRVKTSIFDWKGHNTYTNNTAILMSLEKLKKLDKFHLVIFWENFPGFLLEKWWFGKGFSLYMAIQALQPKGVMVII